MALIVQKFGGSSVGTIDCIQNVAKRIAKTRLEGHDVVVVVSAMYGETDRLIRLAHAITKSPTLREYDALISTGEQVSTALLGIALNAIECKARSFTGTQIGIHTDHWHSNARITQVDTTVIKRELAEGNVVIIAGFQGIAPNGDVTTLGRGGSDTSAVAVASALEASECQIFTDVNGVYTTDPNLIAEASMLDAISFEEMLELASLGAKVLQMRSVELGSRYNMPIRVLSSFREGNGTIVTKEENVMQKHLVSGIALSREEAIISLQGLPRIAGIEGELLGFLSEANIEIDMIAQGATDFAFTVQRRNYPEAVELMKKFMCEYPSVTMNTNVTNDRVGKLSLVGIGMRSHTGVAATMFQTLGKMQIPIHMTTTSEIKISVIIDEISLTEGTRALHEAFQLDKLSERKREVFSLES